jgi:ABC-type phosphonate transport system ATPase subunit
MSRSPILSVRGLTRTYDTASGGLTVLKGVDLDVMPGEVVGIVGGDGRGIIVEKRRTEDADAGGVCGDLAYVGRGAGYGDGTDVLGPWQG